MKAAAGRLLALAFVPALLLALFAPQALAGDPVLVSLNWVPGINLSFTFSLDGFSILFALIVAGIGVLVMFYAAAYRAKVERPGGSSPSFLRFVAAFLYLGLPANL